ncbi:MAG: 4'-phosphopantetheinyl transferase superfamily protein [Acidobacteriota bacterium]
MTPVQTLDLPETEVHVWWARTDPAPSGAATQRLLAILDANERARYARFHFEKDRVLHLCAHALLRVLCSRYCGGAPESHRFLAGEHGRPYSEGTGFDFNLSHTRGLVACGFVRGGRVGVDVESIDRRSEWRQLIGRVMAPGEQARFGDAPEAFRPLFFEYWTVKEAIAKAWGTGLGTDFRGLEISIQGGTPQFVHGPSELPRPVLLHLEALDQHRLAVAATATADSDRSRAVTVREFPLSWESMSLDW